MISFEEALLRIEAIATPLPSNDSKFEDSAQLILAEDLIARSNAPAHDVSAMDGYGVRDEDLHSQFAINNEIRIKIIEENFAGSKPSLPIKEKGCVRIFTGAPVPAGIDRVIIQENVKREGDIAIFSLPLSSSTNIRKMGSDFHAGDILLKKGTQLTWRKMTTAAAADRETLKTYRKPRVVILATGDELMPPGFAHTKLGAIPESVSFGISTFITENGAELVRSERLTDTPDKLEKAARNAVEDADIVIVTGGASVGEKDYAKSMFEPLGMNIVFSKVAIKPGKPVWCAKINETIILGLPGNPTSALVTARLFLKPLLLGITGRDIKLASIPNLIESNEIIPPNGDRENFLRGYLENGKVSLFSSQDSSSQITLANADLLIRRPPNAPAVNIGEKIPVYDF